LSVRDKYSLPLSFTLYCKQSEGQSVFFHKTTVSVFISVAREDTATYLPDHTNEKMVEIIFFLYNREAATLNFI